MLIAGGGATAVEVVVGEEGHVGTDFAGEIGECRLGFGRVERLRRFF